MNFTPAYLKNNKNNLEQIIKNLYKRLSKCDICPFECKINRIKGEKGVCQQDYRLRISAYNLHFGEEPVISGVNGSGTIFLTGCSFSCIFCQNYPISQLNTGEYYSIEQCARIMINLQNKKAHNINFVTPSHFAPQILECILKASNYGLNIPIAYNNSGYEKVDVLKDIVKFVDIFLYDMKYSNNKLAIKYSKAPNYFEYNINGLKFLLDEYGENLILNETGVALRGIIIRHLVLPGELENSIKVLNEISKLSKKVYIALMNQYFPAYKAYNYKNLSRKLTPTEYDVVVKYAESLGFENIFIQMFN